MRREPVTADIDGHERRSVFVLFGAGQFSRSILWSVTDLLIAYHLVARLGFSGSLTGMLLFATILLSAIPDVLVAAWIVRRPDPRMTSLELQGIFGVASLMFGLLLFGPAPGQGSARIMYVCFVSAAFRLSYAIYDVSLNALISLLPQTRADVPRYVTNKILTTSVGRLIASFLILIAFNRPFDEFADLKVMSFAILPVLISALGLYRVRRSVPPTVSTARVREVFAWASLPWRRLSVPLVATAFMVGLLQVMQRLLPFIGDDGGGAGDGASLIVAFVCGTVIGPILAFVDGRIGMRGLLTPLPLCVVATVSAVSLLYVHDMSALLGAFVFGITTAALTTIIWERTALLVTDHASATGMRIDAPAFALLTTCIKLSLALSSGLFGIVLDDLRNGAPGSVAIVVATLTLGGIGIWVSLAANGILPVVRRSGGRIRGIGMLLRRS